MRAIRLVVLLSMNSNGQGFRGVTMARAGDAISLDAAAIYMKFSLVA